MKDTQVDGSGGLPDAPARLECILCMKVAAYPIRGFLRYATSAVS
jgi:hypothetical protein